MKNVLVLCTGNSCRSQIAHGFLGSFSDGNKTRVYSAGIETHGVNPKAVLVMKEKGIDISEFTSNNVDEYDDVDFDYIITVCDHAKENCPVIFKGGIQIHHNFRDPAKATGTVDEILQAFREVRDEISEFCHTFVQKEGL